MTRRYHSPRREQEAAQTRRDILDAATELFFDEGYGRVTVAEIARRAGVAQQTVYSSAGSKAQILREILNEAIASTNAQATIPAIQQTDDLRSAIVMLARGTRLGNETQQTAIEILLTAMPVHEDAARLWAGATGDYRQALGQAAVHLHDHGLIEDVARATDVLWFCFGFNAWRSLVRDSGWSWDDAERWLAASGVALLGGDGARPGAARGGRRRSAAR